MSPGCCSSNLPNHLQWGKAIEERATIASISSTHLPLIPRSPTRSFTSRPISASRDLSGPWTGRAPRGDALVAIWGGNGAQGVGGTGAIVAAAHARGLSLTWIRAGNRKPGMLKPGDEQGKSS